MGGGNRKKFYKSRNRRISQSSSAPRAFFVEGGILDDWSFNSQSSAGRKKLNGGDGKGKSDSSRSRTGKGKRSSVSGSGSGYVSTSRGDLVKSSGNAVGYVYPSFDSQDSLSPNIVEKEGKDFEARPILFLDSKDTPIVVYVDKGPNKNTLGTEYAYDYTAGFTLDENSHRGLGFSDDVKETPACLRFSSKIEKKEGSFKPSTSGEGPDRNIQGTDCIYDYPTGFTLEEGSHKGWGFQDEVKDSPAYSAVSTNIEEKSVFIESSPSKDEDMIAENGTDSDSSIKTEDDVLGTASSPVENPGFLSIGGLKIYTKDISDDESDEEELLDEESADYSETGDSTDSSDSGSDIDDEIAADYIQGIGGSDEFVNIDQLVGMVPSVSEDDSDSSNILDETVVKLRGIDLQEASKEYGMIKPQSEKKIRREEDRKVTPGKYDMLSAMDDLMLVKDPRTAYRGKRHTTRIPQSWPFESQKSQKGRRIPGEKKKHRKEMIAVKRRERMIRRGVDLQHINSKLQQMVLDGGDILSFQPMHTCDCSQVQRLAAIYRLRSASQGSGKKKFVTVTRTRHTCMPSSTDIVRLEKLIGVNDDNGDFTVCDMKSVKGDSKTKKASKYANSSLKDLRTDLGKNKRSSKRTSLAAQPVSFISSGVMLSDAVEVKTTESSEANETCCDNKGGSSSLEYGTFELHTRGFGSKIMAKMGYVEGQGLGKDGQGMAEPIEVSQRPKSLGLGADIPESIPEASDKLGKKGSQSTAPVHSSGSKGKNGKSGIRESQFAAFEKYTTGFGSKMMAKMGFVEGMGLGKDSQGMVTPLAASRRPKSQGLGAKR